MSGLLETGALNTVVSTVSGSYALYPVATVATGAVGVLTLSVGLYCCVCRRSQMTQQQKHKAELTAAVASRRTDIDTDASTPQSPSVALSPTSPTSTDTATATASVATSTLPPKINTTDDTPDNGDNGSIATTIDMTAAAKPDDGASSSKSKDDKKKTNEKTDDSTKRGASGEIVKTDPGTASEIVGGKKGMVHNAHFSHKWVGKDKITLTLDDGASVAEFMALAKHFTDDKNKALKHLVITIKAQTRPASGQQINDLFLPYPNLTTIEVKGEKAALQRRWTTNKPAKATVTFS